MSEVCSFCNKSRKEVTHLIAGPEQTCYICDECVEMCHEVLLNTEVVKSEILTPEEIKVHLDRYVIGQDSAKETLAVAIYNHFKRINNPYVEGTKLEKSNIFLMGPSGCGKTLIVQTIADLLNIPCVIADSTSITAAGYVGQDVESIFERLLIKAGGDIELAQKGIVFIDEIDKKCKKAVEGTLDVGGEGVQQRLLRLIEGDTVVISEDPRDKGCQSFVEIETKDMLFIVGGACVELDKIIQKRMQKGTSIGLGGTLVSKNSTEFLQYVEAEDLHQFGFIREFIGRFPILVAFHNLDADYLVRVLKEPENNLLSQYKGLFRIDGVALEFDDLYIKDVAIQSIKKGTGARGLRAIIEKSLSPVQFVLPRLSKEGLERVIIGKTGVPEFIYGKAAN